MDEEQNQPRAYYLKKDGTPVVSNDYANHFVKKVIDYCYESEIKNTFFDNLEELNPTKKNKFKQFGFKNSKLEPIFIVLDKNLTQEELALIGDFRYFKQAYEYNDKYYYLSNQWNNAIESRNSGKNKSIENFVDTFKAIYPENLGFSFVVPDPTSKSTANLSKNKNITDNTSDVESGQAQTYSENNNMIRLSKPFLLLAGISGTGKTRFVREQAKASGRLSETYCLTSVRPDWHEPSDLLGYVSRLNGTAHYITTDVLQFIAKAWRAIADGGLNLDDNDNDNDNDKDNDSDDNKQLVVSGKRTDVDQVAPYWLCLDEMNLAPVEQYFADYLSVLETREWQWGEDDRFTYSCDPLLKASVINQLAEKEQLQLRTALGFINDGDKDYDDIWGLFCKHGIGIPLNLIVAGTVNMDETTHGFSRKVIDRALTFDFGDFFPNDFNQFFVPQIQNKILSYPIYSQARVEDLSHTFDIGGEKSIEFLTAVNTILDNTPFKLAFRALNELLLAVISQNPQDDKTL